MSLIELELIEQLFTAAEKEEIINQLKDAMVLIRDERLRSLTSGAQERAAAQTAPA